MGEVPSIFAQNDRISAEEQLGLVGPIEEIAELEPGEEIEFTNIVSALQRTIIDELGVKTDSIEQPTDAMDKTSHTTQTVGPNDEDDY